ncbi:MAG TPA: hypothetical protein VGJ78_01360 [Vicinamibacterales bacterium]
MTDFAPISFTVFSSCTPATRGRAAWRALELSERTVCPACAQLGAGVYVSFESDMRLAFACPSCRKLVWIAGA